MGRIQNWRNWRFFTDVDGAGTRRTSVRGLIGGRRELNGRMSKFFGGVIAMNWDAAGGWYWWFLGDHVGSPLRGSVVGEVWGGTGWGEARFACVDFMGWRILHGLARTGTDRRGLTRTCWTVWT